jgi:RNA polymerase sigma-70 factor (ECF subfamily)
MDNFEDSLIKNYNYVLSRAFNLCQCKHKAKDMAQDVMIYALLNKEKFAAGSSIERWLMTLIKNHFINIFRHNKYNRSCLKMMPKPETHTLNDYYLKADADDINKAIEILPKSKREIIKIYASGCEYHEMAERFNIPIGTVKSRLNTARNELRKKIIFENKRKTIFFSPENHERVVKAQYNKTLKIKRSYEQAAAV